MHKTLATLAAVLSVGVAAATPALADVSTTQTLPVQACNAGTMNAAPGTANVTPCGHGG